MKPDHAVFGLLVIYAGLLVLGAVSAVRMVVRAVR